MQWMPLWKHLEDDGSDHSVRNFLDINQEGSVNGIIDFINRNYINGIINDTSSF